MSWVHPLFLRHSPPSWICPFWGSHSTEVSTWPSDCWDSSSRLSGWRIPAEISVLCPLNYSLHRRLGVPRAFGSQPWVLSRVVVGLPGSPGRSQPLRKPRALSSDTEEGCAAAGRRGLSGAVPCDRGFHAAVSFFGELNPPSFVCCWLLAGPSGSCFLCLLGVCSCCLGQALPSPNPDREPSVRSPPR